VAHNIIGIPFKGYLIKLTLHPHIKGVVQEQNGQQRANHAMDAKDNFEFERLIPLCRSDSVLDLRHKK